MTTIKEFENAYRKFVEHYGGHNCYIQEQMGPDPEPEYFTIYINDITVPQYDIVDHQIVQIDPEDEDAGCKLQIRVRGQAMVTLAISKWGGTATEVMQSLSRVRNAIFADQRWQQFIDNDREIPDLWSISGKGQIGAIIPIPLEYEGERRYRAEFPLTVHTAFEDVWDVDHFNEVDITCRVEGKGERTIQVGIDDDTYGTIATVWNEIDTNWELLG